MSNLVELIEQVEFRLECYKKECAYQKGLKQWANLGEGKGNPAVIYQVIESVNKDVKDGVLFSNKFLKKIGKLSEVKAEYDKLLKEEQQK